MNGQLNEHALAELIREISEKKLSGSLRLQHEHSKVVVYLEKGRVAYAASNVRSLRLAGYLKKHQVANEAQLEKYAGKRSDLALAAALITDRVARREEIIGLLKSLVADVLRLALLWTEGTWQLDERKRLDDPIQLDVDPKTLLLESARRINLNVAASHFSNPNELISPGDCSSLDGLLPTEGFLLSRVEQPLSVSDLLAVSGLPEADTLRTIYGLTLAGFLQRENWTEVFRTTASRTAISPKAHAPAAPQRSEEDDLGDFLKRMDAAGSHYEVLNVVLDSPEEDIKKAYYGLARKYHPDRFRGRAATPMHARLESDFARITQSYETLMDATRRKNYDAKVAAREKAEKFARAAPKATTPRGQDDKKQERGEVLTEGEAKQTENIFKEGFAALQQGQINVALGLLGAAARALPQESRYRAYYGRALAAHTKTRRSAEGEMQAALRIEPNNATYRVMLAELYRDLGFARRALAEAERALILEPGNADARTLARKLKQAGD